MSFRNIHQLCSFSVCPTHPVQALSPTVLSAPSHRFRFRGVRLLLLFGDEARRVAQATRQLRAVLRPQLHRRRRPDVLGHGAKTRGVRAWRCVCPIKAKRWSKALTLKVTEDGKRARWLILLMWSLNSSKVVYVDHSGLPSKPWNATVSSLQTDFLFQSSSINNLSSEAQRAAMFEFIKCPFEFCGTGIAPHTHTQAWSVCAHSSENETNKHNRRLVRA